MLRTLNLNKPPSLIETVEWVKFNFENKIKNLSSNLGILSKDSNDQKLIFEKIKESDDIKN